MLPILGCQEEECTPRQHFEIMQEIRLNQHTLYNKSPFMSQVFRALNLVSLLELGACKWIESNHYIRLTKKICRQQGVPFRAFDRAHERYGLLKLPFTEEVKTYMRLYWEKLYKNRGIWLFQVRDDDFEYDLGMNEYIVIVDVDKDGSTSIDGFTMKESELSVYLEDTFNRRVGVIWYLRTDPQVKTKFVFDLMDTIFAIMLKNSYPEDDFPISGRFTFSESTDITPDRLNRLLSSEFFNPDIYILPPEIHFLIHLAESGEIFLNGKRQSSIEELIESLSTLYNSEKGSSVYIVVDDEVSWSKTLEVGRRLRDEDLWIHGGLHRSKHLAALQSARRSTQ
jgi:biopolymer transport protein ExbD